MVRALQINCGCRLIWRNDTWMKNTGYVVGDDDDAVVAVNVEEGVEDISITSLLVIDWC